METPVLASVSSMTERAAMYNGNALKIGLFGANCSNGAVTVVPERWSASWPNNVKLARMADDAGIDFMLPVARWKGYGGDADYHGTSFETVTWACGLLASTRRITVFGTVHAPLFNPLIAAKEFVTADHIGEGRFGLNVVVGWNEDEFEMFGVTLRDHEKRYEFAEEWLDAVKCAWGPEDEFDFAGQYIRLAKVRAKPKPYGGGRPLIMNAGASPTGRAFALRNCDAFFTSARSIEEIAPRVRDAKAEAASYGREIDVYTFGGVTCRPTAKEAEDYYRHCIIDNADWMVIDYFLAKQNINRESVGEATFNRARIRYAIAAVGVPVVGDPEGVAARLAALSTAGLRGIAITFVNYLDELPFFCAEVLPRLKRMGLRE